jgi:maltooligosyltrehalose trehalohydrolase
VHAIVDESPVHILEEMKRAVGDKLLIAETDRLESRLAKYGLDGQWHDDFHHALHALLTGERAGYYAPYGTLDDLAHALEPRWPLVGFAQNHDQIGNRARGDRLCHLVGAKRQRIAAALVLLGPFTPLLFMGEEWAASTPFCYFTDHQDPALAQAVRDGRRREFAAFGWKPEDIPDPQAVATFDASKLRWDERAHEPHASMLAFHRDLLALRREHPGDVEFRARNANRFEMHRGDVTVRVDLAEDALDIRT